MWHICPEPASQLSVVAIPAEAASAAVAASWQYCSIMLPCRAVDALYSVCWPESSGSQAGISFRRGMWCQGSSQCAHHVVTQPPLYMVNAGISCNLLLAFSMVREVHVQGKSVCCQHLLRGSTCAGVGLPALEPVDICNLCLRQVAL